MDPVLIVDDDFDVRQALCDTLADEGYPVAAVADAAQALAWLERAAPPSMILLDWRMPGMDGGELYTQLRARPAFNGVPVVLLTADIHARQRAIALGVPPADVLAKPIAIDQLLGAVASRIGGGLQA